MKKASAYYFILRSIEGSLTLEHLDACDKMINNIHWLFAGSLAVKSLLKRCELLTARYSIETL